MNLRVAALIVAAVVVADRVTKWLVMSTMERGDSIPVIPGFFSLTYVRNPGAAFGVLADSPLRVPVLSLFAVAAVAGLTWLLIRSPESHVWERGAAASIIGGAIGNLYDRFAYGWVVDFLDVYVRHWHWPAFNVADSCITVGVALLLLASVFGDDDDRLPSPTQDGIDAHSKAG